MMYNKFFSITLRVKTVAIVAGLLLPLSGVSAGSLPGTVSAVSSSPVVTLERIMDDSDWMGNGPEEPYFSDDDQQIYYQQKRMGSRLRRNWSVSVHSGKTTPLTTSQLAQQDSEAGRYSADRRFKTYSRGGDIFVKELATGVETRLTATSAKESDPRFIGDTGVVAFWRGNTLLKIDRAGLSSEMGTLLLKDAPQKDTTYNFLKAQQQRYFVNLRAAKKDRKLRLREAKAFRLKMAMGGERQWYLGANTRVLQKSLSPDGHYLLLVTADKKFAKGKQNKMARMVTDSGRVEIQTVRRFVGQNGFVPNYLQRIDLVKGKLTDISWQDLPDIHADRLAKIRRKAIRWHVQHGAKKSVIAEQVKAPADRRVSVMSIKWAQRGNVAAIMIRANDNKDRWIATLAGKDKKLKTQHQLTDKAWINWSFNEFGWTPSDQALWYLSEQSGYSQLYIKKLNRRRAHQLTKGAWEVSEVTTLRNGKGFYFRGNKSAPGSYEIYRLLLKTGRVTRVTSLGGGNDYVLSHDQTKLLLLHSNNVRHPEIYIQDLAKNSVARRLTHTISTEYSRFKWIQPEIVKVPSSHVDKPIYAKLYKPAKMNAGTKYPAVFFVHGAGYLQNSDRGWSYYFHEMMFNTLLVNEGYVVIDMDYRGSAGYGRDWRTAIYRNMGHPEVDDLADGIDYLVKNFQVDRKRVGIYGGSYGGFLTFMALFTRPELFAAGAALRPVGDWSHYNHGYTSNILNTPLIDPMAFARSSPIEFVAGLKKPLLVSSGMLDDNVFYQDSVRVIQRLIELKKKNFELASYPMEHHGFKHATSWLDEYRRIHKLMRLNLN